MASNPSSGFPHAVSPHDRRLESWKEIAAYLNRSVSTVQRWEAEEGLPVHRLLHSKAGTVYALTSEIDAGAASATCCRTPNRTLARERNLQSSGVAYVVP